MTAPILAAALCTMAGHAPACDRARAVAPIILAEARDLDPLLIGALMFRESAFRPDALSSKGAVGLMQVMPTGDSERYCRRELARLWEPRANVRCAVRLLRRGLRLCGSIEGALSRYVMGRCGKSKSATRVLDLIGGD